MTFAEAAMIMMPGGKKPNIKPLSVTQNGSYNAADYGADGFDPVLVNVPSASMSLEGVKKLKTLATVTIGEFVFNLKTPSTFSMAGTADYVKSNGNRVLYVGLYTSYTINDVIAGITNKSTVQSNYYLWPGDSSSDIPRTSQEWENFSITSVDASSLSNYTSTIGTLYADYNGTRITKIDGVQSDIWTYTTSSAQISPSIIFSSLDLKAHCDFVADYCKALAVNTPIVNIL